MASNKPRFLAAEERDQTDLVLSPAGAGKDRQGRVQQPGR
jgi:hypothetical protein